MIIEKSVDVGHVDVEVDFDLEDVLEFIENADSEQLKDIRKALPGNDYIEVESIADEMKMEFIATIFDKFTLEQLEERLK